MIQPDDVMKAAEEDWDAFKKEARKDPLYYDGPGDLLDTPEGRAKFCTLNETAVFRKPDPAYPGYKIWVFNLQGKGLTVKRRSRIDPTLMEDIDYDADGKQTGISYEPA